MAHHRLAGGVLALCALAGMAGCGGGDDDDATAQTAVQNDGQADGTEPAVSEAPDTEPDVTEADVASHVAEVNILTDFGDVCRGVTLDGATAYDATRAGVHPLITMAGESPVVRAGRGLVAGRVGSGDRFPEQTVELVACLDRTATTLTQTCDGYLDDDGNDSGNKVEMYDASYNVRLVATTTSEEVASTQMDATDPDCPMLVVFDEGDPRSRSSTRNPPTSSLRGSSSTSKPETARDDGRRLTPWGVGRPARSVSTLRRGSWPSGARIRRR